MDIQPYPGLFYNHGVFSEVSDVLAVEEVLRIAINDEPFSITMRSPGCENELVRGLLFSEGIYTDATVNPEISITEKNRNGDITAVNVRVPAEKLLKKFAGTRNVISVASCGVCGKTALDDTQGRKMNEVQTTFHPDTISLMFETMARHQEAFSKSGGTHACGAFDSEGALLDIKEDIGRHNAVDKVLGGLLMKGMMDKAIGLTVSGRISYEIVNKARMAGIPLLASVSAPSSLAVENAIECGMTLLAFCRNNKLTVYAHTGRITRELTV